jgi:1,4-alpha-glucan branching enzyme
MEDMFLKPIIRALGTANPPLYTTQQEAFDFFRTHFNLDPEEEKLYRRLLLESPIRGQVNVAGNFNGWRPEATPLENTGAGEWLVRLRLRSGQYEYRFVMDGRWSEDPRASQRVANPYGNFNSVLLVPLAVGTSIL